MVYPRSLALKLIERSGLLTALWIGTLGGGLEVAACGFRRFVLGRLVFVGRDFWWLLPIATAAIVTAVTVVLVTALPARWTRARWAVPLAVAALEILLTLPGLASWGAVVLAMGIALRVSAFISRREGAVRQLVRRSVVAVGAIPWLAGAWLHVIQRPSVVRAEASVRTQTATPNVLLIVLDTVRAIELGLYGLIPSTSPNLDGFAREGVVFDQAFSTAPWSAPSHASLFTGRDATELSIDWERPLDSHWPTLAGDLRSAGYNTVGLVANTMYVSAETGLDRGFGWYEDDRLTWLGALSLPRLSREAVRRWRHATQAAPPAAVDRVPAEHINARFLRWLDRHSDRPYFAFLNYYDAHAPYLAPEPFWSRFLPGRARREMAVEGPSWSAPVVALRRRAYQAAIANLDAQIGALLDALLTRNHLANTIVVITADHGEEFAEHRVMEHGHTVYTQSTKVPLIVVWMGRLKGNRRVNDPVSLARIPATIERLLGRTSPFPGPPLLDEGGAIGPTDLAVASSVTPARNQPADAGAAGGILSGVRVGRFRFLESSARPGHGELYDHERDPAERENLAIEPWAAPIMGSLRDSLAARSAVGYSPRASAKPAQ